MKNTINIFVTLVFGAIALPVLAVPAQPGPIPVTAPDGSTVNIRIIGDEFSHFTFSDDGYLLTYADGFYNYASVDADGNIHDSGIQLRATAHRNAEARKFLSAVDRGLQNRRLENRRLSTQLQDIENVAGPSRGPGLYTSSPFPSTGDQKAVVILVEFVDVRFADYYDPHQYFTDMLNLKGFDQFGGTGSARDYFEECSGGLFRPQFDVYGPVTLSCSVSYYGGSTSNAKDQNPKQMVIEACNLLDDEVDFSQYDRDGDGAIDNVFIFYAGKGENSGGGPNTIWPHASYVTSSRFDRHYYDGVLLDRYACTNEVQGDRPDGVGTFIHEFSHVMGLPDLYATSYTNSFTPGGWSALDSGPYNNGGRTPPLYGAFERYALDWMRPQEIVGAMNVVLPPIGTNQAYLIQGDTADEYFLLENRQQTGWDRYIPGHGMLIWHIDYDKDIWWSNKVNNTPAHQRVDIEEADGVRDEVTRAGDAFPGTAAVDSYPEFMLWSRKTIDMPLTEIREDGDGIIRFRVCGGVIDDDSPICEVPLVALDASDVSHDSFTANWVQISQASDYVLSVYTKEAAGELHAVCDFSEPARLPEGFEANTAASYSMGSYVGKSAPALRLSAVGDYIDIVFDDVIHSIEFWHRGNNSGNDDVLEVSDAEGTVLATLPVVGERGGKTYTVANLPASTCRLRISYRGSGSVAIDDIDVAHGIEYRQLFVEGKAGVLTGNCSSHVVDNLDAATEYYYTVQGINDDGRSIISPEIKVVTAVASGVSNVEVPMPDIHTTDGFIVICGAKGIAVTVSAADGRVLFSNIANDKIELKVTPGIYVVRCGERVDKLIVR